MTYITPKKDCLKCEKYDECAQYSDGRCILKGKHVGCKYEVDGVWKTATEWAKYYGLSQSAVIKQLQRNGAKGLKKLLKKQREKQADECMQGVQRQVGGRKIR
ncbi:MAG: hypothetical protein IJV77_06605 [Clostridia bacterium]|nr:hypothetical protein [Clostridia bacterium]